MRYHTKSELSSDRGMTPVGLHPDPEVRHFELGVTKHAWHPQDRTSK